MCLVFGMKAAKSAVLVLANGKAIQNEGCRWGIQAGI